MTISKDMDSERSVGRKRKSEDVIHSASGKAPAITDGYASFFPEPPVTTFTGFESFNTKPISLHFPSLKNLDVSEVACQSLEKISTAEAEAECKQCASFNNKPVTSDFPYLVSEDVHKLLEQIKTAAAECTNLWDYKITSPGYTVPLSDFLKVLESLEEIRACAGFINKPISSDFPCFENLEVSEDLRLSLEKISKAAAECTNLWNNKITNSGEIVPLSDYIKLLESHGLLWHKCIVIVNGEGINADHLRSRICQRPSYMSDLLPDLNSESHWQKANEDFCKVGHICYDLVKDFNGEQVGQLASFLDYLIMIQEEQQFVAYSFVQHLVQLKNYIVRLNNLCTNKSNVACDGAEDEFPRLRSKNPAIKCMWKQKHMFDSLYIMARESSLLLKKADTCLSVSDELHKIVGIIKDKEFRNARELLGRSCGRNCDCEEFPAGEYFEVFAATKSMKQFLSSNFKRLDQLHRVLQGQIVCKSSVAEMLVGCFHDVVRKGKLIELEYLDDVAHRMQLLQETGSLVDIQVVSEVNFANSVKKTLKQIDEAVQKLTSLRGSILQEESPHGKITLWRVLFESSLVDLRLDLICENLGETINRWIKPLDSASPKDSIGLNQLYASIVKLIGLCNGVLFDVLAMHKTVAEVTCMVAEVFVPRCTRPCIPQYTGTFVPQRSFTGVKTSDEQGPDSSFKEDVDICDCVSSRKSELSMQDPDMEDPDMEDSYIEDPDAMYAMSMSVEQFDDDELFTIP